MFRTLQRRKEHCATTTGPDTTTFNGMEATPYSWVNIQTTEVLSRRGLQRDIEARSIELLKRVPESYWSGLHRKNTWGETFRKGRVPGVKYIKGRVDEYVTSSLFEGSLEGSGTTPWGIYEPTSLEERTRRHFVFISENGAKRPLPADALTDYQRTGGYRSPRAGFSWTTRGEYFFVT